MRLALLVLARRAVHAVNVGAVGAQGWKLAELFFVLSEERQKVIGTRERAEQWER